MESIRIEPSKLLPGGELFFVPPRIKLENLDSARDVPHSIAEFIYHLAEKKKPIPNADGLVMLIANLSARSECRRTCAVYGMIVERPEAREEIEEFYATIVKPEAAPMQISPTKKKRKKQG